MPLTNTHIRSPKPDLRPHKYFDGGGHKNAAGGKSYVSMDETIAHYIRSVEEFAREGGLDTPPLR